MASLASSSSATSSSSSSSLPYHERQKPKSLTCVVHVLNAVMGKPAVSIKEFDAFCESELHQEYVRARGFPPEMITRWLAKKKLGLFVSVQPRFPPFASADAIEEKLTKSQCTNLIVFHMSHVYAIVLHENAHWVVDSVLSKPHAMKAADYLKLRQVAILWSITSEEKKKWWT